MVSSSTIVHRSMELWPVYRAATVSVNSNIDKEIEAAGEKPENYRSLSRLGSIDSVTLVAEAKDFPGYQFDHWATGYDLTFGIALGLLCVACCLAGLFCTKHPLWATWAGYRRLLQDSGRAPSDFLRMFGAGPVLLNTGINGLISMAFILCSGGDLNGPTVGGILTIMGFSAFGKHAFNIIPVMAGVFLGGLVMHWSLSDSAVQLACLFCTTLAPISGYFGWPFGVLAGFLHSSVVLYTGTPVAGMNLYNNGFSGGLVAIVLYPVIIAVVRHRKPTLVDQDYFDPLEHDEPVVPPVPHAITEEEDL